MFRWAERIGIPVRLLDAPIWEASRSLATPQGNCIVTMGDDSWSPTGENLDPANWTISREWVARGNTLIIVTAEPEALPTELRKDLIPSTINEITASRSFPGWHIRRQPARDDAGPRDQRWELDGRREGTAVERSFQPGDQSWSGGGEGRRSRQARAKRPHGNSPPIRAGGFCFASPFGAARSTCFSTISHGRTAVSITATTLECWRRFWAASCGGACSHLMNTAMAMAGRSRSWYIS